MDAYQRPIREKKVQALDPGTKKKQVSAWCAGMLDRDRLFHLESKSLSTFSPRILAVATRREYLFRPVCSSSAA